MTQIQKDHDAAANAPKPKADAGRVSAPSDNQDAKKDDETKDGGKSLSVDDMNSANDE